LERLLHGNHVLFLGSHHAVPSSATAIMRALADVAGNAAFKAVVHPEPLQVLLAGGLAWKTSVSTLENSKVLASNAAGVILSTVLLTGRAHLGSHFFKPAAARGSGTSHWG
jgi:hypothetical protein